VKWITGSTGTTILAKQILSMLIVVVHAVEQPQAMLGTYLLRSQTTVMILPVATHFLTILDLARTDITAQSTT
jgi:hypothetical protein